jgi:hypothetical protein
MSLQKIAVFLKDFIEVHNLPVHAIQQFGKRWKAGNIVSCEKTISELLEKSAPIRLYVEHVEEAVSAASTVVNDVERVVESFKKKKNKDE